MRPIDVDEFLGKIGPDEYYHTNEIRDMVADTLAAGNDPLTLEELREMDGEPVWVVQTSGELRPFWMLVDTEDESAANRLYAALFEDYRTEWLAYRRKPEEIPYERLD